jgi:hypothetical protein
MQPNTLFAAALAVSLLHGLIPTPVFGVVIAWSPLWWPFAFQPTQSLLIYAAALLISSATLLVAGVPAALYERLARSTGPSATAGWIWLAGCALLTALGVATRG